MKDAPNIPSSKMKRCSKLQAFHHGILPLRDSCAVYLVGVQILLPISYLIFFNLPNLQPHTILAAVATPAKVIYRISQLIIITAVRMPVIRNRVVAGGAAGDDRDRKQG